MLFRSGLSLALIAQLEAIATGGLAADLTLWLDLPLAESLRRRGDRPADRIEATGQPFLQRVADGFAELAQQRGWQRLDASQPPEVVADQVAAALTAAFSASSP